MDRLYEKVSQLTNRKRKKQSLRVSDKHGSVLTDSGKMQQDIVRYRGFV